MEIIDLISSITSLFPFMILENLGVEVPPFEIYSARKITSPIDFLQHKMGSRVSK